MIPRAGPLLLVVVLAAASAGCASEGVAPRNFELTPDAVGWYAGEEASFTLTLVETITRPSPSVTLDRRFVLEELQLNEQGARFGGNYRTREPDAVGLRLLRAGVEVENATLDLENPTVELRFTLPPELRDSEYVLELQLFQIGWVKSAPFRVDHRA